MAYINAHGGCLWVQNLWNAHDNPPSQVQLVPGKRADTRLQPNAPDQPARNRRAADPELQAVGFKTVQMTPGETAKLSSSYTQEGSAPGDGEPRLIAQAHGPRGETAQWTIEIQAAGRAPGTPPRNLVGDDTLKSTVSMHGVLTTAPLTDMLSRLSDVGDASDDPG